MIGLVRFRGSAPSASLGWVPAPTKCDDVVGQIQQVLNIAYDKKRLGDKAALVYPIMPLDVDGRADEATQQALAVVMPGWELQMSPVTTLRELRQKFSLPAQSFSCLKPRAPEGPGFWASLPSWAPAAGVAAAILFAAAAARGRV